MVYREEETHPAAGLSFSHDLECTLDGRGGDLRPVGECAFTDLDAHAYHLGASPLSAPPAFERNVPLTRVEKHHPKGGSEGGDSARRCLLTCRYPSCDRPRRNVLVESEEVRGVVAALYLGEPLPGRARVGLADPCLALLA